MYLESARRIIPPTLYWLVHIMITSDETGVDDFDQQNPCQKRGREAHSEYFPVHHPLHIKLPHEAPKANRPCNGGLSSYWM